MDTTEDVETEDMRHCTSAEATRQREEESKRCILSMSLSGEESRGEGGGGVGWLLVTYIYTYIVEPR